MENWLAAGGIVVSIAGWVASHFKNKGYTDRQLQGYDEQIRAFWTHVNNRAIHEESMDARLINEKFRNVDQKFESMGDKIDGVQQDVRGARQAVHDLKNEMPGMILAGLNAYGKGKGA